MTDPIDEAPAPAWDFDTMPAAELVERVVGMLEQGRLPVLRARYKDGQPVNVGFYLVPDYSGLCANCKQKAN